MSVSTFQREAQELIPTVCNLCYGSCSILVRKSDGVVAKIEGNPASPIGNGRLCPKGVAGIMTIYDPNRVTFPLKRTNPEKGIGVDPRWVEITWEEALDTISERLIKVRSEDPRKLVMQVTTTCSNSLRHVARAFLGAFGSSNIWAAGGGVHCGNGAHKIGGMIHASWSAVPDFDYCNYAIYFGTSKGHSAGHVANVNAQKAADARARGMRIVVVDPMLGSAASKSTEWIPIRVGTDAALALSMVNVLLNELGIHDVPYLKSRTNGPYLIKPDGLYARDPKTGRPLVWDVAEGVAKVFDDPGLNDVALDGKYDWKGVEVTTAFRLLKEHVRKFTPEMAAEITTVPAPTIRRLAQEFGENARVGSTIRLDGKELPYRPAAAIYFRGAQGHKNSMFNCLSIALLSQIVGGADVPGGTLGFNPASFGHPETGRPYYVPTSDSDGLMITGAWLSPNKPYPPHEPGRPYSMGLLELFPLGQTSSLLGSADQEELWQKCGLPYRPEIMINWGANSLMSVGNANTIAESLKKLAFVVSFDLFLNEFTDFADIVLPDTNYLERYDPYPNPLIFSHPAGMGEWGWPISQPAMSPPGQARGYGDVMIELGERVGLRDGMNASLNLSFELKEPYSLDLQGKYSWPEICDRTLKTNFGAERGLEWFERNGIIKWPKRVEEVYWRAFVDVRVPIYMEHFKRLAAPVRNLAERFEIDIDFAYYEALPDWLPCPSHQVKDPQFDLYGIYYRDVLHTNSFTLENPWLDEAATMNPYSYLVSVNAYTARKKGLKDDDLLWIESVKGRRIKGRVRLTESMHPEALAIAACAGHWSPNQPIARGKGVFFNDLLEIDLDHVCHANLNLDLCVKVKIYKADR
ncbi:MAG: molybdopterin-dependent oxidoreductase [Chloroflexi bacterium]|nr:molybdopterin-dependent oxidoreductase [Chloroflexota bacterium]